MEITASMISFALIAFFYSFIGSTTVLGSIYLSKLFFTPKVEQIFFGVFLSIIAGFYLVFTVYFGADAAWGSEMVAALFFALLGLIGIRVPAALMVGYALHGLWDIFHEFEAHAGDLPWEFTSIPLAYGFFCLTYDVLIAVYFWTRRKEWQAAWATSTTALA
ncbi:DUF6010 family protein [Candidatus Electronema sp. PJ]|uniref:DUF6010 family protein n=1 Tax=Candidatus Electronema sp. PJ TaxID=3401572 RepID=UPI003AA845D5